MKKPAKVGLTIGTLVALVVVLNAFGAESKTPSAEAKARNEVRRLLVLTGAKSMAEQLLRQTIAQFRQVTPHVPAIFWDNFLAEADTDELMELVIPVHQKHFSASETAKLIKFYESPLGRKLVQEQPLIAQEFMVIGQAWGARIGEKAMQRMKAEGYGSKL